MKAIGMPPSDSRIRQMNDAQWLWSYLNVIEDEKIEEETWKARLDYLGFYVNPELARSVMEQDEQMNKRNKNGVGYSENGDQLVRTGVYNSSDFSAEAKAASLGYDPESGLSPTEFIKNYYEQQSRNVDIDVLNDDFDDLLNSGQFTVIAESDSSVGDRFESAEDFLARAQGFVDMEEFNKLHFNDFDNEEIPIGIESEEEWFEMQKGNTMLLDNLLNNEEITPLQTKADMKHDNDEKEALRRALEEMGLTEDDLDIIEVPDDNDK